MPTNVGAPAHAYVQDPGLQPTTLWARMIQPPAVAGPSTHNEAAPMHCYVWSGTAWVRLTQF